MVTDDMPFLVDSVTAEVVRQKAGLDHVVHPVVLVRRDATGNLLQFCDSPRSDDSVTESWIAVLLSRQVDDEAAHDLIAGLRTVLADVRRVHEDAARLHDRALDVAHSLEQQRGHGPDHEAASVGGDPWSVLFALSMLARYEPDRWYKHISVASSPEAVPIENLLNLAMSSVPRTLLQVFTQLRDQLAT